MQNGKAERRIGIAVGIDRTSVKILEINTAYILMIGIGVLEKTSIKQKKKKSKMLLVEVTPMHHPFILGCTNRNYKITVKEHGCPW